MGIKFSPLVSVIVPAHNRVNELQITLRSIAAQTYPHLEVILVDDASSQDVRSVLDTLDVGSDVQKKYLRSETNIGPGAAREMGRLVAKGDFICYLDSDDNWDPEKVEKQVNVFLENPDIGMCYCISHNVFDDGSRQIRKWSDRGVDRFFPTVFYYRPWGTGACMWSREAVEKIGAWSSGWIWEDHVYDVRAGCHDVKISFLAETLCYYTKSKENGETKKFSQEILRKKVDSLVLISNDLRHSGCYPGIQSLNRLSYLLFFHGLLGLQTGSNSIADRCFKELLQSRPQHHTRKLITLLLLLFGKYSETFFYRFGMRMRPYIYSEEVIDNTKFRYIQSN